MDTLFRHVRLFVCLLFLGLSKFCLGEEAEFTHPALLVGEKLHYNLYWGMVEVGTAVSETTGPVEYEGQQAYRVRFAVRTNAFADMFYKVRDETISYVDLTCKRTLGFTQVKNEGGHKRDVKVLVDWDTCCVTRTNFNRADGNVCELPESGVYDPLTLVLALRLSTLEIGSDFSLPTTNGKALVSTEVDVVRRKEIAVDAGDFKAILLKPDTKDLKGVFKKSKGAGIDFWCTDDERKIPLVLKSKVSVGSFRAVLSKVEGPRKDVPAQIEKDSKKRRGRR